MLAGATTPTRAEGGGGARLRRDGVVSGSTRSINLLQACTTTSRVSRGYEYRGEGLRSILSGILRYSRFYCVLKYGHFWGVRSVFSSSTRDKQFNTNRLFDVWVCLRHHGEGPRLNCCTTCDLAAQETAQSVKYPFNILPVFMA